ncbi:Tubulin beta chain [Pelomyxa schiedti]|nr:Tubulin beta chain [Pelomyxa schiedti]
MATLSKSDLDLGGGVRLITKASAQSVGGRGNGVVGKVLPSVVSIHTDIVGFLAQTCVTLVFRNTSPKELTGELELKLKSDATVVGYAVNMGETMVEASIVPKDVATKAFSSETRHKSQVAIAEQSVGNIFRCKVHPFNPLSERVIQVWSIVITTVNPVKVSIFHTLEMYPSELVYETPFQFSADTAFKFIAEAEFPSGICGPPHVKVSANPAFQMRADRVTDNLSLYSCEFMRDSRCETSVLRIDIPLIHCNSPLTLVEQDDDSTYFCVQDYFPAPAISNDRTAKVGILWDCSRSHLNSNIEQELLVLSHFFGTVQTSSLDLVLFSTLITSSHFLDASKMLETLKAHSDYNGGTDIVSCLQHAVANNEMCDFWVFISDGISSWGDLEDSIGSMDFSSCPPINTLCCASVVNHSALRKIAYSTKGIYVQEKDAHKAALTLVGCNTSIVGITDCAGRTSNNFFASQMSRSQFYTVSGCVPLLAGGSETISVFFQNSGKTFSSSYSVSRKAVSLCQRKLVSKFWALSKLDNISLTSQTATRQKEFLSLCRKYQVLSSVTSLVVLETIEQYLRYGIEPPSSQPELQRQYFLLKKDKDLSLQRYNKRELVLNMWKRRLLWLNDNFLCDTVDLHHKALNFLKLSCDDTVLFYDDEIYSRPLVTPNGYEADTSVLATYPLSSFIFSSEPSLVPIVVRKEGIGIYLELSKIFGSHLGNSGKRAEIRGEGNILDENNHPAPNYFVNSPTELSTFSQGREIQPLIDDFLQRVQKLAEASDSFSSKVLLLSHDIATGLGSGTVSTLLSRLSEEYPSSSRVALTLFPSLKSSVVQSYNTVLAMPSLIENSTLDLCVDRQGLQRIKSSPLGWGFPSMYNNRANLLYDIMLPHFCEYESKMSLEKIQFNLVPYPRLHFMIPSIVPVVETHTPPRLWEDIKDLFTNPGRSALSSASSGTHICSTIFSSCSLFSAMELSMKLPSLYSSATDFAAWAPANVVCTVLPPVLPLSEHVTLLTNSRGIHSHWSGLTDQFTKGFQHKIHIERFVAEGLDEMEFTEAESNLNDLCSEYQQYQECVADDEGDECEIPELLPEESETNLMCEDVDGYTERGGMEEKSIPEVEVLSEEEGTAAIVVDTTVIDIESRPSREPPICTIVNHPPLRPCFTPDCLIYPNFRLELHCTTPSFVNTKLEDINIRGLDDVFRKELNRGEVWQFVYLCCSCAVCLWKQGCHGLAIKTLSNIAEIADDNADVLRTMGYLLLQFSKVEEAAQTFERILHIHPDEPRSYLDLALSLLNASAPAKGLKRAYDLFSYILEQEWDARFNQFEVVALMDFVRLKSAVDSTSCREGFECDHIFEGDVSCSLRVVLNWNCDMTDVELQISEPSGECCSTFHNSTTSGGILSKNMASGYGPVEYITKHCLPGIYIVSVQLYHSPSPEPIVPVCLHIYTNFGQPSQTCTCTTCFLTEEKEVVALATIEYSE